MLDSFWDLGRAKMKFEESAVNPTKGGITSRLLASCFWKGPHVAARWQGETLGPTGGVTLVTDNMTKHMTDLHKEPL
jgi:hypothetical protein